MTKTDLIDKAAELSGLTKKDTARALGAMLSEITVALSKGDKVALIGFGSFEVRERSARVGHSPNEPGKIIEIPAKKVPVFRPGKDLKKKVL